MSNKMIPILALSGALGAVPALMAQSAQTPQTQQQEKQVGTTGTATPAEVEAIVDNPGQYYGKKVTIVGDVNEVFGPRMFNIREEGLIDVDDTLLVIHPAQRGRTPGTGTAGTAGAEASGGTMEAVKLTENATVRVTGTVRQFVRRDLERDYGIDFGAWGITDDNWFTTYDRRPVLIAERINVNR